jgi:hypothetical protein
MITSDESCLCCDTFLQNCYIFLYFEMLLVCHGDVSKLNASLPHIYQPMHYIRYQHFFDHHWIDTSGVIIVSDGHNRPVVRVL